MALDPQSWSAIAGRLDAFGILLPDAWSRYGHVAAHHAAEKKADDELVARNRKYMIEVLGGRVVKDEG